MANTSAMSVSTLRWDRACVLWALPFLCTLTARAQAPPNDLCANATVIGEGTFMGSTVGATTDGEGSCSVSGLDVWFSHTPAADANVTVDTFGSTFDTALSIHTGCPGTTANELACNDDALGGVQSRLTFTATAGTSYLIRLAGFNSASGDFMLNIQSGMAPSNDNCSDAEVVGEGTFLGDNTHANTDGGTTCDDEFDDSSAADVWSSYTAPATGVLTVDTFGSTFDTALSVHTGCPGTEANEVVCNDDAPGSLQSQVVFKTTGGTTHLIRVAGFRGERGAVTLNIDRGPPLLNDLCGDATQLDPGVHRGTTVGAGTEGSASCGDQSVLDVFYANTPSADGTVTVHTIGSNPEFDTVLSIHTSCPATASNEIACNDDIDLLNFHSLVSFDATAETTYWIRVAGHGEGTDQGDFKLTIAGPGPLPGDIDDDKVIDTTDAALLEGHLLRTLLLSPGQLTRADANLDSPVEVADLVTIVNAAN